MATLTIDEIVEAIKNMSVLEVAELVKRLEEEFGVSAAAMVAAAPAAASGAAAPRSAQTRKGGYSQGGSRADKG